MAGSSGWTSGHIAWSMPRTATRRRRAVEIIRAGEAEALMKGSLHTDELMAEVVRKDTGLRRNAGSATCSSWMCRPTPSRSRSPTPRSTSSPTSRPRSTSCKTPSTWRAGARAREAQGRDPVRGRDGHAQDPSTIDAAALCKMAERGQITGALLDGPLAFDNAISKEAAPSRASAPRSRVIPTYSWCPISRRATCSPSSCHSWPTPMPPASCWARGCRSF